jgi:hypothetical protein
MNPKKLNTLVQRASKAVSRAAETAQDFMESLGPDPSEKEPVGNNPAPVTRKVLVISFNPKVKSAGGKKLSQVMGWNDPEALTKGHIADLKQASYNYANYTVVERIEVDGMPVKADGFVYDPDAFVKLMKAGKGFHEADAVDYHRILKDHNIIAKVNSGAIDEVWLFAFPYGGFYESIMAGPGAFWCNAPALTGTDDATRRFIIMGYNYERGRGEMLENIGHRAESIMAHVFRNKKGDDNLWERFGRYDKTHPGKAEVGIVHFAPNSLKDYDWGNKTRVLSRAHVWKKFPNLEGEPVQMDTNDWGKGDTLAHHVWWFQHFPHITGGANGVAYNWWKYVIDPNTVR